MFKNNMGASSTFSFFMYFVGISARAAECKSFLSKASAYPDIVDGIGEIRQHGLETIESAYKEILDTQMKMLENVEQKETYWDVLLSSRSP